VKRNEFRSDLYYRLNVFPIVVPPLRERSEDIVPLVEHYVGIFSRRVGKHIDHIPDEVADAFESYSWPGNIRELQNVVERMVILSDDGVLANPLRPTQNPQVTGLPANTTLKDSERALIEAALEGTGWVIGGPYGAATKLGMKRTTLMARMKKHGILRPPVESNIDQTA
jgi:transcriptional regulator with GAF, ATPase, and Fis domain